MKRKDIVNEDWQKVNKHDKTDGLSQKAVNAYRRENPGSKLKTAVTTKPSKLKKGSKSAKRRSSFCARMSGMKKHNASAKTKHDPDSPINKALRRWNCESIEQFEQELIEASIGTEPKRPARPGSRPSRGHEAQPRYKPYCDACDREKEKCICDKVSEGKTMKQEAPKPRNFVAKNAIQSGAGAHKDKKKAAKQGDNKHKGKMMDLAEMEAVLEKASRALCTSAKPDDELGASNLASCKSQGLRARDGDKSHKLGKQKKSRIKVGGHKIKGNKYGGPLPDWS